MNLMPVSSENKYLMIIPYMTNAAHSIKLKVHCVDCWTSCGTSACSTYGTSFQSRRPSCLSMNDVKRRRRFAIKASRRIRFFPFFLLTCLGKSLTEALRTFLFWQTHKTKERNTQKKEKKFILKVNVQELLTGR